MVVKNRSFPSIEQHWVWFGDKENPCWQIQITKTSTWKLQNYDCVSLGG